MRNFNPPNAGFFAAAAEKSDATTLQSVIRPEIYHLPLGHDGEVAALNIQHYPVQHVSSYRERKRLFHVRPFLAVNHRVPHHAYHRQRTWFNYSELQGVIIVQVFGPESATHSLLVDFAQEFEAIVSHVNAGLEHRQRTRLHEPSGGVAPNCR